MAKEKRIKNYRQLVSIIVPVYNVEEYLSKCLDSILNQTYKHIEIIAVDDGSNDCSGKICDAYAEEHKNINVIHKNNGGLSSARNEGIAAAKGDYVLFVDSDDYIEKNMVSRMVETIEKDNDIDIVVCDSNYVDDKYNIIENSKHDLENAIINNNEAIAELYGKNRTKFATVWGKLFKKETIKNIRFIEGKICEDEYYIIEAYYRSNKIRIISDKLYNYLFREGSIMHSRELERRLTILDLYITRSFFIKNNGLDFISRINFDNMLSAYLEIVKSKNKYEKYNKNELNRLLAEFKNTFFSCKENKTIKNYFKCIFPKAYFLFKNTKRAFRATNLSN